MSRMTEDQVRYLAKLEVKKALSGIGLTYLTFSEEVVGVLKNRLLPQDRQDIADAQKSLADVIQRLKDLEEYLDVQYSDTPRYKKKGGK